MNERFIRTDRRSIWNQIIKNLELFSHFELKIALFRLIRYFLIWFQVAQEIEEAKRRKAIEEEKKRKEDERILELQTARRQAEIDKDMEEKRNRKEKEKDMAR